MSQTRNTSPNTVIANMLRHVQGLTPVNRDPVRIVILGTLDGSLVQFTRRLNTECAFIDVKIGFTDNAGTEWSSMYDNISVSIPELESAWDAAYAIARQNADTRSRAIFDAAQTLSATFKDKYGYSAQADDTSTTAPANLGFMHPVSTIREADMVTNSELDKTISALIRFWDYTFFGERNIGKGHANDEGDIMVFIMEFIACSLNLVDVYSDEEPERNGEFYNPVQEIVVALDNRAKEKGVSQWQYIRPHLPYLHDSAS